MKTIIKFCRFAAFITIGLAVAGVASAAPKHVGLTPAPAKKHAVVKMLSVAAAPVVHPKRSIKQLAGAVLFAVEPVVDVASLGLQALDKAAGTELKHNPFEYLALGAEKADAGIEKAEDFFFGSHN
jgi:hypothetical protein